jgi:hypothetical protein
LADTTVVSAEKEIKITQMKAARKEKDLKKAVKAVIAANKKVEIEQNRIKSGTRNGRAEQPSRKQSRLAKQQKR